PAGGFLRMPVPGSVVSRRTIRLESLARRGARVGDVLRPGTAARWRGILRAGLESPSSIVDRILGVRAWIIQLRAEWALCVGASSLAVLVRVEDATRPWVSILVGSVFVDLILGIRLQVRTLAECLASPEPVAGLYNDMLRVGRRREFLVLRRRRGRVEVL